MNRQEMLFTILAEECSEVSKIVSKILRFGKGSIHNDLDQTNMERLTDELHDLWAMVHMIEEELNYKFEWKESGILSKKEKVEKYLIYSSECGTLDDNNGVEYTFDR